MPAALSIPPQASAAADMNALRRTMTDCQLRTYDITDAQVLGAFETVPREKFLNPELAPLAYSDASLTVKAGAGSRVLLTPMVLARLLAAGALKPGDRALDIGGGLGYSAAILGALTGSVTALEARPDFAAAAKTCLTSVGCANVMTAAGALAAGFVGNAPYDVILLNGAVETHYQLLFDQLASGGRLLAIVASGGQRGRAARAMRFEKTSSGVIGEKFLFDASAAPLEAFQPEPAFVF